MVVKYVVGAEVHELHARDAFWLGCVVEPCYPGSSVHVQWLEELFPGIYALNKCKQRISATRVLCKVTNV